MYVSYIGTYTKNLVGGNTPIQKIKLTPGQVVSFEYINRRKRRIPRLVFILNIDDTRGPHRLVHGINLEKLSWVVFIAFLKKITISDVITLIKRKYELRGPFSEIIDRPKTFYTKLIKPHLTTKYTRVYRTYKMSSIKRPRVWALNYKKLFSGSDETRDLLISEKSSLRAILKERSVLHELFNIDTLKLRDTKYKQLVIDKFGDESTFAKSIIEINEMVDANEDLL